MRRPVAHWFLSLACLAPFGAGVAKEPYSPVPYTPAPACITCALPSTNPGGSAEAPICFYPRGIVVVKQPIPPGDFCACDGDDETVEFGVRVPKGIEFTGRCTPAGCAFIPTSETIEKVFTVNIPAGFCASELTVKMDTAAPIIVCTQDSHCPSAGTTYDGTRYDPQLKLVPCSAPSPGTGPGTGPGAGGATIWSDSCEPTPPDAF